MKHDGDDDRAFHLPTTSEAVTWSRTQWPLIRQSIQTTVAASAAYLVAAALDLPQGYWAVITSILVVQSSVGGSLGLAVDRLIATLLGAGVGGGLLLLLGEATALPALAVSLALLTWVAAARPSLKLAPVTAAIVVLGDIPLGHPLATALNRVFEIGIGTLIALIVTLAIFPARAGSALLRHVGRTLPLLALHLRSTFDVALGVPRSDASYQQQNTAIRLALANGDLLVKEAQREIAGHLGDGVDPAAIQRTLRRLWHTQVMTARALRAPFPSQVDALVQSLEGVRDAIDSDLAQLAAAYRGEAKAPISIVIAPQIAALNQAIEDLRASGVMNALATDEVSRIFSLTFAIAQLPQNLKDLADRLADQQKAAAPGGDSLP